MMKEIYEILSDEERVKKLTRALYISEESIKMISETAKLAVEKDMPLIEFKQRCNGFCDHELVNALYFRAKHEAEAQELTPDQRIQILSDLLAAKHYETRNLYDRTEKRLVDGFEPGLESRLKAVIEKMTPTEADRLMRKFDSVSELRQWLNAREEAIKRDEEYQRIRAMMRKKDQRQ